MSYNLLSDSLNKQIKNYEEISRKTREERELELKSIVESKEILEEFKEVVQSFIDATNDQTKVTQRQNTITFWVTIAAGLATIFSAVGVYLQLKVQGLL